MNIDVMQRICVSDVFKVSRPVAALLQRRICTGVSHQAHTGAEINQFIPNSFL